MANIEKISSVVQNEKIVEKINELADGVNSSLKEAPVLSVNGQTGEVQITRVENADNADTLGGKSSSEFATAEQGNKADTALQAGDVTKETVGLENVANERQYSAENPPPYPVVSVAGKAGTVSLVKDDVGLNNVDNTSDLDKPVSAAQSVAIADAKKAGTDALDVANGKYTKPNDGIPKADLDVGVQASLSKADTALQKAPVTSVNGATGDVQIDIPTRLSELTNDSGFITATVNNLTNYYAKTLTYTKTEVDNLLSAIPKFGVSVVDSLPTTGISSTTVYLIPNTAPDDSNLYDEYIYVLGKWEKLGTAKIDLSNYVTVTQLNSALASYAKKTEVNAKYTKPSTGIPKSDLASAVQTSLNKADSALQAESDPTVPAWAKQPNKPSYTKDEIGLGNVANERQYSVSNPPPYPVTSVNGQTGAVKLSASDVGALTKANADSYYQPLFKQVNINQSNVGWVKVGSVLRSKLGLNRNYSCILLVNGIYQVQGDAQTAESGLVEFDIRDGSTTAQIYNASIIGGNIKPNEWCVTADSNSINIYVNLPVKYQRYLITVLNEGYQTELNVNFITLSNEYYGTSAPSGAIYATVRNNASNTSNPNLLINSNFKINQRGQTSYNSAGYCVDRWRMYPNLLISVVDDGIQMSYSGTSFSQILQPIDRPMNELSGKVVTASCSVNGTIYTLTATLSQSMGIVNRAIPSFGDFTIRYSSTMGAYYVGFYDTYAANPTHKVNTINWVKLEYGDTATEYTPPDPATELLRCRRYYGEYLVRFGCIYDNTKNKNYGYGAFLFDTEMRTTPTMETYAPQSGTQKGEAGTVRQVSSTNLTQLGGIFAYNSQGFEVYAKEGVTGYMKYNAIITADAEIY